MADNRYRERGGHGRGDSIFSDDKPQPRQERERPGEDRGFFQRASGEGQSQPWGDGDWDRGQSGVQRSAWRGDMGQGSFSQSTGAAPFDDQYRSWRDRQISELDREYDEYRQHRQQQFENEFSNWRQNRSLAEGSGATSGGPAAQGGNSPTASEAGAGSGERQNKEVRGRKPQTAQ